MLQISSHPLPTWPTQLPARPPPGAIKKRLSLSGATALTNISYTSAHPPTRRPTSPSLQPQATAPAKIPSVSGANAPIRQNAVNQTTRRQIAVLTLGITSRNYLSKIPPESITYKAEAGSIRSASRMSTDSITSWCDTSSTETLVHNHTFPGFGWCYCQRETTSSDRTRSPTPEIHKPEPQPNPRDSACEFAAFDFGFVKKEETSNNNNNNNRKHVTWAANLPHRPDHEYHGCHHYDVKAIEVLEDSADKDSCQYQEGEDRHQRQQRPKARELGSRSASSTGSRMLRMSSL